MKFIIHTDGGARGNPGPAAIGIIIEPIKPTDTNKLKIIEIGKRIGKNDLIMSNTLSENNKIY